MRTSGNPFGAKWAYTVPRPHEHNAGQGRLRQRPRLRLASRVGARYARSLHADLLKTSEGGGGDALCMCHEGDLDYLQD